MGCCCRNSSCCGSNNKTKGRQEREIPEGIDPCCKVRGPRCVCLPYDDPFAITAQIFSLLAVFISWIWWLTFSLGMLGMVLFQLLWCTRMSSSAIYGHVAIASITSVINLLVAIYVIVAWRDRNGCFPFSLMADDDSYDWSYYYDCTEKVWFVIALICALMWATAAACLFYFVKSGRHAKWEKKFLPSSNNEAVASPPNTKVSNAEVVESDNV